MNHIRIADEGKINFNLVLVYKSLACILIYEILHQNDVGSTKEDDEMRTAGEIVKHLNETRCNIYVLSEQLGLGRTTLRARLLKLGYEEAQDGVWQYQGDDLLESADVDVVTSKRVVVAKEVSNLDLIAPNLSIHDALMHLDLTEKATRTTISLRSHQIELMKTLADTTRLRLNDVYSLAISQFLERYAAYVKDKKDKS